MSAIDNTDRPSDLQAMIQAYLWCGIGGLAIGIVAAVLLVRFGPDFMQASPLFAAVAVILVTTIASAMTGGLMTLSPVARPVLDGEATRRAERGEA